MRWKHIAAGDTLPTLFTDTLLRNASAQLGNPWVLGYTDATQASAFSPTGGIVCNNTVGLTLRNPTGGGSAAFMPIIPAVFSGWNGKTQFAQCTLSATQGVAAFDAGPAVALQGDSCTGSLTGYYLSIHAGGTAFSIRQANVTNRLVTGNLGTWSVNDIFLISVQFAAGANTLLISKNGTLVNTTVDNDATRPLASNGGVPGIFFAGAATANGESFKNYRCGLGLSG